MIFDFYNHNQKPIELDMSILDWYDNPRCVKKIFVGKDRPKKNFSAYADLYAELTLDEYLDSTKGVPYEIITKWCIYAGRGVPKILPLYSYYSKTDLTDYKRGLFQLNTNFTCGDITYRGEALYDTGATITHITLELWIASGLAEKFLDENKNLCNLLGVYSVEDFRIIKDLEAEKRKEDSFLLPMKKFYTVLGNGERVTVYSMRMDKIVLQNNQLGGGEPVVLNNIDVRIIKSTARAFIIGENVINYLTTQMGPIGKEFHIKIDFTNDGKAMMENHRKTKNINNMPTMYILDDDIKINKLDNNLQQLNPSNTFTRNEL